MTAWAFILSIIFIDGWTGSSIPTGWQFIALTVPWMIWRDPALPWPITALGMAFIVYALAAVRWSLNIDFAIHALWMQGAIAGCFILGYKLHNLDGALRGFLLGACVSSALAVAQWFGWNHILTYANDTYPGLYYNPVIASEVFAVLVIWLLAAGKPFHILPLTPGILLETSRSGIVAMALSGLAYLVLRDRRWLLALIPLAFLIAWYIAAPDGRDTLRLAIWSATLANLSPFGAGPGAMDSVLLPFHGSFISPEYAHNEFLDYAYQYGLGAAPFLVLALAPALATDRLEWPAYIAFLAAASYSFPLHSPPLAAMGALLAGHLCSHLGLARGLRLDRGYGILSRSATA